MPNFNASELNPAEGTPPRPGDEIPVVDDGLFDYLGVKGYYTYDHHKHTLADITRLGYFDPMMKGDANRYFGALIFCTARGGQHDPAEWKTCFLRVTQVCGARGVPANEPTKVIVINLETSGSDKAKASKSKAT